MSCVRLHIGCTIIGTFGELDDVPCQRLKIIFLYENLIGYHLSSQVLSEATLNISVNKV